MADNASLTKIEKVNVYKEGEIKFTEQIDAEGNKSYIAEKTHELIKENVPVGTNVIYNPSAEESPAANGIISAEKSEDGTITLKNHPKITIDENGILDGKDGLSEGGTQLKDIYIKNVGFIKDTDNDNYQLIQKNPSGLVNNNVSVQPTMTIAKFNNKGVVSDYKMEIKSNSIMAHKADYIRPIYINVQGIGSIANREEDNVPGFHYIESDTNGDYNSTGVVLAPTTITGLTMDGEDHGPAMRFLDRSKDVGRSLLSLGVDIRKIDYNKNSRQYGFMNVYKWDPKYNENKGGPLMVGSIYGGVGDDGFTILPRKCYTYDKNQVPDDIDQDFSDGQIGTEIHRFKHVFADKIHGNITPKSFSFAEGMALIKKRTNSENPVSLATFSSFVNDLPIYITGELGNSKKISNMPHNAANGFYFKLGGLKEFFIRGGTIDGKTDEYIYVKNVQLDPNKPETKWHGPIGCTLWKKGLTNIQPIGVDTNKKIYTKYVPKLEIYQDYIDIFLDNSGRKPLHLGLHCSTILGNLEGKAANAVYEHTNTVDNITYHLYFAKSKGKGQIVFLGGLQGQGRPISNLSFKQYS